MSGRRIAIGLALAVSCTAQAAAPAGAFDWVRGYAKAPTKAVVADARFPGMLQLVAPQVTYSIADETVLPAGVTALLARSATPVRVREGRYYILSGSAAPRAARAMLWIDVATESAWGVVYTVPNGPGPRLLFFARQRSEPVRGMSDLPPALFGAVLEWQRLDHLPSLVPPFYQPPEGGRVQILHDESFCVPVHAGNRDEIERCRQTDLDAANIDLGAAYQLMENRMNLSQSGAAPLQRDEEQWFAQINAACAGRPKAEELTCRTHGTHERAQALVARLAATPAATRVAASAATNSGPEIQTYRNDEAGVEFDQPVGWSASSDAEMVRLAAPDSTTTIRIWTESGSSFDDAAAGLAAALMTRIEGCTVTVPAHADQWNGLPVQTASGAGTLDGTSIAWRADLLMGKNPVVVLTAGPVESLIANAPAIAAFQKSFKVLP